MGEQDSAFSDVQYQAVLGVGVDRNYWFQARHRLIADALMANCRPGATVLDVGCGPGFAVKYLRQLGFASFGVELSRPKLSPGVEEFVTCGVSVSDTPTTLADQVEVLTFLDVIEHVGEPVALLKQALERCPSAQHVVVTVPARNEIWSNYDEFFGHHRRYSRTLLTHEAKAAGLEPVSVEYVFHSLYAAAWAVKLLGQPRSTAEKPTRYPSVHRFLAGLLRAESRLLPSSLPGSSVLGVFRRARTA